MLQLPHTATAGNSAVIASDGGEVFPADVRSLIALHREAEAAVDAAQADAVMVPLSRRAESIYRALVSATPDTLQEEAERLSYVLAYVKPLTAADGQIDGGWLDMPELSHIAKNLTKLAKPIGPAALKIVSKDHQPLKACPEPSLKVELDRLQAENDIYGMIALYDYFIAMVRTNDAFANLPRASSLGDFIDADSERIWAKAYAVADRLKKLKPTKTQRKFHARALIDAAFAMGGSLKDVAAVAQHLSEAHE